MNDHPVQFVRSQATAPDLQKQEQSPQVRGRVSKPRILFYLPGLYMGGAERHTLDLRQRLEDRGFHATVLVHSDKVAPGMLPMVGAEYIHMLNLTSGMSQLHGWPRVFAAFKRLRPDVIVAVNETMAIRSVVARRLGQTQAKLACTFHTTLMLPHDEHRLPLFRWAARALDALIFVSGNQAAHWASRKLATSRPVAIVNGVDLTKFPDQSAHRAAAKKRLGLAPDDYVLGLLATFRVEKNHGQLVEALNRLKAAGMAAKVVFVGDGVTRVDIERRVAALGLAEHVVFAGEHADVRPVIAAFDVGVICSTQVETLSLAALEQLASGVPMVMSEIGGASEIVEHGVNGFLFPAADTDALTDRLTQLADPVLRAALQSQARVSAERHSIDRMADRYAALFEDLVAEPAPR